MYFLFLNFVGIFFWWGIILYYENDVNEINYGGLVIFEEIVKGGIWLIGRV